ncbi:MarR family winged helix-turn-helix transcriptional regulator [Streptomyces sp. NPDC090106]|uniref:MarR family winged helix-turn-helix transcriptional regulator n=1 Tax=Streptomyces sp. NPDC090106 TaxID=3365946 RepID=UPI003803B49E
MTRWLNPEEQRAWRAFLAAGARLDRRLDQQLKEDAGITHLQYEILVRLGGAPGGEMRMSTLADALLNTRSGLTYQIGQLEKAGLVGRRHCPSDTRAVFAVLTDAGRRTLEEAAPGHVGLVRELLIDVLTPEQLTSLADGLEAVNDRMRTG